MEDRNNEFPLQNHSDSQAEKFGIAPNHNVVKHSNDSETFDHSEHQESLKSDPMGSQFLRKTKSGVFVRFVKKSSLEADMSSSESLDSSQDEHSHDQFDTLSKSRFVDFSHTQGKLRPPQQRRPKSTLSTLQTKVTHFNAGDISDLTPFPQLLSQSLPKAHEPTEDLYPGEIVSHQKKSNVFKIKAYLFITSPLSQIFFFGLLILGAVSLIVYLLLAEHYNNEEIYRRGLSKPEPTVISASPGNTVRFFDLFGTGKKFLFLVDTALSEETQFGLAATLVIKTKIRNSLALLKDEDSFEILFFNTQVTPVCSPSLDQLEFHPAKHDMIAYAVQRVNQVQMEGHCSLENAISTALGMKPDVIFFVCQAAHLNELTAITREELASNMKKVKLCAVEIASGRKPLTQTYLQLFVKENQGQYQWVGIDEFQMSAQDGVPEKLLSSEGEQANKLNLKKYLERGTEESIQQMLYSDFDERFIIDISTEESHKHSPFGRKRSLSDAAQNSLAANERAQKLPDSPKTIDLSNKLIQQIEEDARIVYLSSFVSSPQNPRALRIGAESRLALWVQGAKAKLPAADYLIGLCYRNGVRVNTNETKAFQCELRAAENGCLPAMYLVSDDYFTYGADSVSFESAKFWLEKGATSGEPFALLTWANSFVNAPKERFLWVEKAAQLGLPAAQFQLGQYFENGTGTDQNNEQAAIWFEKAAQQGYVP